MKDIYGYGGGLYIFVKYGRVHKIRFISNEKNEEGKYKDKEVVLERGSANKQDFFDVLKIFMEDQAKYNTTDFMELYIGLTDDPEAKELADEIYHNCVDNDRYPVGVMKTLANESKSDTILKKNAGVNATFGEYGNYIHIENGIVTLIEEGSNYAGRNVSRKNSAFYNTLYYSLELLASRNPNGFMKFYRAVEGSDDVAFEIAERVRKDRISQINSIFNI